MNGYGERTRQLQPRLGAARRCSSRWASTASPPTSSRTLTRDRPPGRRDLQPHAGPERAVRRPQRVRAQGRHARRRRPRRRAHVRAHGADRGRQRPRRDHLRAVRQGHRAVARAEQRGLEVDEADAAQIVERVKALEHQGYQFEAAVGSFDLLIRRETGDYEPLFRLESWRVIVEKRENGPGRDRGDDQDLGRRRALRPHRRGQRSRARARQGAARGDRRDVPAPRRHRADQLQGAHPERVEGHRRDHARAARRERRRRVVGLDRRLRERDRGELARARRLARGGHAARPRRARAAARPRAHARK